MYPSDESGFVPPLTSVPDPRRLTQCQVEPSFTFPPNHSNPPRPSSTHNEPATPTAWPALLVLCYAVCLPLAQCIVYTREKPEHKEHLAMSTDPFKESTSAYPVSDRATNDEISRLDLQDTMRNCLVGQPPNKQPCKTAVLEPSNKFGARQALFCLISEVPGACCLLVLPSMCLQDQTNRFWADV